VAVFSDKYSKAIVYVTNNFELSAVEIDAIYANRWQIETFFKKLKQNFPLTYFFGDNSNAIEIQVWCALIALLLLDVTHKDHNSNMPFSILSTIIRLHIMNYVGITAILDAHKQIRSRIKMLRDSILIKKSTPHALQLEIKM
jgi:hypothetical protein